MDSWGGKRIWQLASWHRRARKKQGPTGGLASLKGTWKICMKKRYITRCINLQKNCRRLQKITCSSTNQHLVQLSHIGQIRKRKKKKKKGKCYQKVTYEHLDQNSPGQENLHQPCVTGFRKRKEAVDATMHLDGIRSPNIDTDVPGMIFSVE